jgi:hypothetical protein
MVDAKTGGKRADEMIGLHTAQIAAYQLAIVQRFPGREVRAAILRTADFIYGGPVIHQMPWHQSQLPGILAFVPIEVAQVRAGRSVPRAGSHCRFCPALNVGNCEKRQVAPQPNLDVALPELGDL